MARYELSDGKSDKFWEIKISGSAVTTTWGRIGTDGQTKTKDHGTKTKAQTEHDKLVAAKEKKGYTAAKKKKKKKKGATKKKAAAKKKAATKKTAATSVNEDGWQRYELVDARSSKFWEVRVADSAYETRYGRIGDDGKVTTKDAGSAIAARRAAEKVAATKVDKGYSLVQAGNLGAASRVTSNPALEKEIEKDSDALDAYLVYSDWLQGEGDPRGELVAVQAALLDDPSNKTLKNTEKKLVEKNVEHFFGPHHSQDGDKWNRTFDKPKREKRKKSSGWRGRPSGLEGDVWTFGYFDTAWHCGFVRALSFTPGYYGDGEGPTKTDECVAILAEFLANPSARFLRTLVVGDIWLSDYEGPDMTVAVKAIAESPVAGTVEELRFIGGDHDINGVSGDYGPLVKACKNLKRLEVYGNHIGVGKPDYPQLESFRVYSGGLPSSTVRAIANAKWPKLTNLDVMFGADEYGASGTIADIKPIMAAKGLSKVKRLGLRNAEFTNEICEALVGSKILKQIEHLDLSLGTMTSAGAQTLIDNKKRFAHLKTLALDDNYIGSEVGGGLAELGPAVSLKNQDDDLEYVYASVGE